MKLISSRVASSAVLVSALVSIVGCGDDESAATSGGGGEAAASTSNAASSSSTSQSSSSATATSTGQGGEGTGGGGGDAGAGGDAAGGSGSGGDGAGGRGEGGGNGLCLPSATTVDLPDVVARATTLVEAMFETELGEPSLWFQDGLNAVGFPAPNDMGAIVVAFEVPDELAIFEGELITYRATIWGEENIWLGRVAEFGGLSWDVEVPAGDEYFNYYTATSGLGLIADGLTEEQGNALDLDFETAFPGSSFIVFADLGVYTFVNVEPASLADAFAFLEARDEVTLVEPDGEVYATDFGFGPRVSLEGQLDDGPVDVYEEHAFLSHWLRREGAVTHDAPTLPEPYGPGSLAQSPSQRYEIAFADGVDVEACLEELAGCSFDSETVDGVVYLIDPSYLAASALRHACIDYLLPVFGDDPV